MPEVEQSELEQLREENAKLKNYLLSRQGMDLPVYLGYEAGMKSVEAECAEGVELLKLVNAMPKHWWLNRVNDVAWDVWNGKSPTGHASDTPNAALKQAFEREGVEWEEKPSVSDAAKTRVRETLGKMGGDK